ncbi:MAG: 4Fe-4S binding protein [Elusimicrobia bacterium]|nr:4Fe-4S binding protein [Elusimicrobiota bacterium]
MRIRYLRYTLLTAILAAVIYLASGHGARSFEAYCPFGGAESLWGLFTNNEFSCTLAPLNLSLMLALLALAVLAKKAFCGWSCPIGFLGELLGHAGGLIWRGRPAVPPLLNGRLKALRYVVLALALFFTYKTGELVLRGYDPYFLVFSGFGHGSSGLLSVIVLTLTALGALAVPMMFCRYLCPMGAVFDPFSRLGFIRLRRDKEKCTACGKCAAACPCDIPVDRLETVSHYDCTNCLECVDACPEKDVFQLRCAGLAQPLPKYIVAALAVLALTGGYFLRTAFTQPTATASFSGKAAAKTVFIVDGLKCKGTAGFFTSMYKDIPGIGGIETYASEHKAVFTYDPDIITRDRIRAVMETPVEFKDGTSEQVFKSRSMK